MSCAVLVANEYVSGSYQENLSEPLTLQSVSAYFSTNGDNSYKYETHLQSHPRSQTRLYNTG